MIVTENCIKPNLHGSFLSSDEGGVWMQRQRRDLRDQSLSHTSTVRLHGFSPERRRYLGEDEIDQAGRRQSACLLACRGLDMSHIKGRREEAGGITGSQIWSLPRGTAGVMLGRMKGRTQTAWMKPINSWTLISNRLKLCRLTRSHLQVSPNAWTQTLPVGRNLPLKGR